MKYMDRDSKTWASGVEVALNEFEEVESYPTSILLCGGGTLLPEMRTSLKFYPWLQELPFERFPKIEYILPKDFDDFEDEKGFLKDPTDVAPLSLALMSLETK